VIGPHSKQFRLPDVSSIFTAELKAIILALEHIFISNRKQFVIFSDSLSCLQALKYCKYTHPLVLQICEYYHRLITRGKSIDFCWVPSHVGIHGNERADRAAKAALEGPICTMKIPHSDFIPYVCDYVRRMWQAQWDACNQKLRQIKKAVGEVPGCYRQIRRDEIVLARARMGHTYFTHSFLLRGEPPPQCIACQCSLTVKHILIECVDFAIARVNHFTAHSLDELFNKIDVRHILSYLKEIGLYYKF